MVKYNKIINYIVTNWLTILINIDIHNQIIITLISIENNIILRKIHPTQIITEFIRSENKNEVYKSQINIVPEHIFDRTTAGTHITTYIYIQ